MATWATGAAAAAWAASAAVTAAVICACSAAAASASAILKETKKNCGLELAKAAGAAENEEPKEYLICRRNGELWLEWNSTTTQQAAGEK
jgi:hypothetical protein